jgi:RNA polymerase sigma factor (sigma-70 family)
MAATFRSGTAGQIQQLFDGGTYTGLSDARLLERFITNEDDAAFAALVSRHGALVLNTCQAVLKDPNAASDAFQATFVLLFRKAASIRGRDALGVWLHRVAYRTALQVRADAARRREVEKRAGLMRPTATRDAADLDAMLHEEIERLPERVRRPVVLCYLEGMTRDQAADYLRCTEGTVRGRLAKGRDLLRQRLGRRGIALGVPPVFRTAVPESLVATTVRAVAGEVSASVAAIVAAAARGWAVARLNMAGVLVLGAGLAASMIAYGFVPAAAPPARGGASARPAAAAPAPSASPIAARTSDDGQTMPVEGRVLDLEGRPVAGASIKVQHVEPPPNGKLDAWIDEFQRLSKLPQYAIVWAAGTPRPGPLFSVATGRDGRFRIEGLPREAYVVATISGPGIETSGLAIMTRDRPAIRAKDPSIPEKPTLVWYGARFDHVVAPARPIVGTVRDKDTGAPIPGVHITGMPNIPSSMSPMPGVEATTDAAGRYRIDGLPVAGGFKLFTEAPAGQPYVNHGFTSPGGDARLGPLTFDIALKRGVLVHGRLIHKVTRQPLRGSIHYFALRDNPHLDEYSNFKRGSQPTYLLIPGDDGRFTIPALPGRGLITGRASEDGYLHGIGADSIKGYNAQLGAFETFPFFCSKVDQHILAEINPAPGTEVTLELEVDPGRTASGMIVDPDGRAVAGDVEIRTLDVFQGPRWVPNSSARFAIAGLPSGRYRLDFVHRGRKLAGSLTLGGDEKGDMVVKLQPWGTVTGRVVDGEGRPRTDVEIFSTTRMIPDPERGDLENKPTVDARGYFRIEGLVPGVKYDAWGHSPGKANGPILKGVQLGPGEVKDLGDIPLPAAETGGA